MLLEVIVPTYNRPCQFEKCLASLLKALHFLPFEQQSMVGISIRNNSTKKYADYAMILDKYGPLFNKSNIGNFEYLITGFNIGSFNNCASGLFSSDASYVWFLPDDDLARFDSLKIAISSIQQYKPCFISGAWIKKTIINYSSEEDGSDSGVSNEIFDIIYNDLKVSAFLEKNVVQAQEYIYDASILKSFLMDDSNISLINEMFPGVLAIYCLQSERPFVRLSLSLGIFRDGDPESNWRHLWARFSLIEWPKLSEIMREKKWMSYSDCDRSIIVFESVLEGFSARPDFLLGLNRRQPLNPYLLYKYHKKKYLKILLLTPLNAFKKFFQKLRLYLSN